MVTKKAKQKEAMANVASVQDQRNKANEAQWIKAKRTSTEQGILEAGRQTPKEKK
ncbi:MAG: hypothetical protein WCW13_06565 [archaeon]|jgi:hypothetical protein